MPGSLEPPSVDSITATPTRAIDETSHKGRWLCHGCNCGRRHLFPVWEGTDLDVTTAIRIDPTQPEFFDNRGLDLAGNRDYARAIADYDEAINIRPEAKFLTSRGDAYQARKDYDRATCFCG
jgi:hypothetical protein